jgi:phosphate transport system protein
VAKKLDMSKEFDEELEILKKNLVLMSAKAGEMIQKSVSALLVRDVTAAGNIRALENEINQLQLEIDNQCSTLIALRQPVAQDLRFIIVAMKISSDLERIGDKSISILKRASSLASCSQIKPIPDIPRMADMAGAMMRDAIEAFGARDVEAARQILIRDDEVDLLKDKVNEELVDQMGADPQTIKPCLQLVLVARNLERIADHATNIAKDTIYLVESKDIRHQFPNLKQQI